MFLGWRLQKMSICYIFHICLKHINQTEGRGPSRTVFWFVPKPQAVKRLHKHAVEKGAQKFLFLNKMLSKKKRVTKEIFQTILKKGNIAQGSFFLFKYIPFKRMAYSFVVAKKTASKATKRNSLRRIGYNILREYSLKAGAGVFFYKKEALTAPKINLKNDIENLLKKAKLI